RSEENWMWICRIPNPRSAHQREVGGHNGELRGLHDQVATVFTGERVPSIRQSKKRVVSCDLKVDLRRLVHRIRISPLVPRWAVQPLLKTLDPLCSAKRLPPVESGIGSLREI